MDIQILQSLITPSLGTQDLPFDLLDLDGENLDLMIPLIQSPLPAGFCQFQSGRSSGDGGKPIHDAGGNTEHLGEWLSDGKLNVEQRRTLPTRRQRRAAP